MVLLSQRYLPGSGAREDVERKEAASHRSSNKAVTFQSRDSFQIATIIWTAVIIRINSMNQSVASDWMPWRFHLPLWSMAPNSNNLGYLSKWVGRVKSDVTNQFVWAIRRRSNKWGWMDAKYRRGSTNHIIDSPSAALGGGPTHNDTSASSFPSSSSSAYQGSLWRTTAIIAGNEISCQIIPIELNSFSSVLTDQVSCFIHHCRFTVVWNVQI